MALRLELRVVDTETGNPADMYTHNDLTTEELSEVNMFIDTLQFGAR